MTINKFSLYGKNQKNSGTKDNFTLKIVHSILYIIDTQQTNLTHKIQVQAHFISPTPTSHYMQLINPTYEQKGKKAAATSC